MAILYPAPSLNDDKVVAMLLAVIEVWWYKRTIPWKFESALKADALSITLALEPDIAAVKVN